MSSKNVKTIPRSTKRKLEELKKFRDNIIQHKNKLNKITTGDCYKEILQNMQKDLDDVERKKILNELSDDNSELVKLLCRADVGDALRNDVIESMEAFIDKIDKQIKNEARKAVEELLKDDQTRDEIIERVSELLLSNN